MYKHSAEIEMVFKISKLQILESTILEIYRFGFGLLRLVLHNSD